MQFRTLLATFIGTSILSGCGGSDNTSSTPTPLPTPNEAPTLTVGSVSGLEGSTIEVEATASDNDGSIDSYDWSQTAGPSVDFENGNATISFSAPNVKEDTELKFLVVVTDDDGATAEETVTVTISANMRNMSVSGKVTDGPIADANVEVVINGKRFTTIADASGNYKVDISVDDSFDSELIKIVATGPGANSPVKLVSYLDSVAKLVQVAGDDGELTKDDLHSVNVTNVTTAQAALMEQVNGGEISNVEALEEALVEYDDSLLIEYATAIKLVIDYATENPELALPETLTDTLTLVQDPQAAADYINHSKKEAAEVVERARKEIYEDPEIFGDNSDAYSVADSYYIIMPDGRFGQARLVLNEDGTGSYLMHDMEAELTWTETESGVEVTFTGSNEREYVSWDYELQEEVTVTNVLKSGKIKWLTQTAKADTLVWSTQSEDIYKDTGELKEQFDSSDVIKTVKSAGVLDAKEELTLGTYYVEFRKDEVISVRDAWCYDCDLMDLTISIGLAKIELKGSIEEGGTADVSIYKVDGQSELYTEELAATWSIDDKGLVNLVTTGEEYTFNIAILENNQDGAAITNNKYYFRAGDQVGGMSSNTLEEDAMIQWTDTTAPGIYSLGWDHFSPNEHFWVEVNADGSAQTVSVSDDNEDGQIDANEIIVQPGYWTILNDGEQLNIRRYKDEYSANCDPGMYEPGFDQACRLYHERTWSTPVVTTNTDDETEFHIAHLHRFYWDAYAQYQQWNIPAERIVSYVSFDNRRFIKLTERPVEIDAVESAGGLTSARITGVKTINSSSAKASQNLEESLQREDRFN